MIGGLPDRTTDGICSKQEFFRLFGIVGSALAALVVTAYCLTIGVFIIFPHLFYIPIVLAAYLYPTRGAWVGAVLAGAYLAEVFLLSSGGEAEIISALVRAGVFLLIAAVVSHLAGRLQVREARYRGIFETSGAGIFLFSPQTGKIKEMNQQCATTLGYSRDAAPSLEISTIWPGYPGFAGSLEEGRIEGLDCNLVARDGTSCPVLLSASLLPGRQEGCVVTTGTVGLKQMENRLRHSKEMLRVILDATDVGILLTDPGKEVVEANATAARFFGATGRDDLIGMNPCDLVAERDRETILAYREGALFRKAPVSGECTLTRLDGTNWPAEITITPFAQDGAAPGRLVISLRDITERRRAKRELQEENRHLAITNEVMAAAAASHRLDDLLPAALEKIVALLDYNLGTAYLARPGSDFAHLRASVGEGNTPPDVRRDEPPYRYVFIDGEARFVDHFHEKYPGHDIPAIQSFAAVPIPGDDGPVGCITVASKTRETVPEGDRRILAAIGRDLGNVVVKGMLQEDLEVALASANHYLEEANAATDEVNLYVDILTHDINNANTAAMGYLHMYLELAESDRVLAKKALTAVYQSSEIIRNVLTLRHLRTGPIELRPVRLEPVLRGMRSYYVDASIAYEGSDVVVLADSLIDEIFANLIGNAVKFGGPDVEITVSVQESAGGMVSVTVADTGPGIPDDLKPRLFERSQRGTTNKSGKGLGLYIVRMLAERYGGSVRAGDRVPGQAEEGAAITVILQRYSPEGG